MKKITRIILALAALGSLRTCATTDLLDGKEITATYQDGKPVFGVKFGTGK